MKNVLLIFSLFLFTNLFLYAQPANDDCANAIAVTIDEVVDFTTLEATTDGVNHTTCLGDNDSIVLDVWYTFSAAEDAVLRWSNCGTADFDSRVAVYNVTLACDADDTNIVACNDDGPAACSADFFTSEVLFAVTGGQDYVLRMGGYADEDGEASGTGTVVLTTVENLPVNTFCANATVVELGTGQEFSTLNAITDGPDHEGSPCFGFGSITAVSDIWYTYTADFTGFVQWSTCNMADFDTRLTVYNPGSACPPLPEDLYSCNDDGASCEAWSSLLNFAVASGETYLLRLGGYDGSGSGTFDLMAVIPPDPPANDDCSNAIPTSLLTIDQAADFDNLTIGTTVAGTFISDDYQYPVCLGNQAGGEFSDVWYTFETLGNTEIDLQLLAYSEDENPATNFWMDIFASCDAQVDTAVIMNSCISVDQDNGFAEATLTGLPEGENITYFIRITTRLTSDIPGGFAFQLVAEMVSDTENPIVAEDLTIFPNPVRDQATVRFTLPESALINASVTDLLGQQIRVHELGLRSSGLQEFELDTNGLPASVYFLQLTDGKAQQSLKFVVN